MIYWVFNMQPFLKNIYALGAGIAHGLEYGDNFLSVYIANAANEMVRFLKEVKHEAFCVIILIMQHQFIWEICL